MEFLFQKKIILYIEAKKENKISHMTDFQLIGKSKLPVNYDFAIGESEHKPNRIIKVVNSLKNETAKSIIFSWNDVYENRKDGKILILTSKLERPIIIFIFLFKLCFNFYFM